MLLLRVRQVFAWGLDGAATLSTHRGKPCCLRLKTPRGASWRTRSQDGCRCRGGSICFPFYPFFLQRKTRWEPFTPGPLHSNFHAPFPQRNSYRIYTLARGWAGGVAETARSGGPAECKDLRRGEEMTDGWGMLRTVVGISGGGVYRAV